MKEVHQIEMTPKARGRPRARSNENHQNEINSSTRNQPAKSRTVSASLGRCEQPVFEFMYGNLSSDMASNIKVAISEILELHDTYNAQSLGQYIEENHTHIPVSAIPYVVVAASAAARHVAQRFYMRERYMNSSHTHHQEQSEMIVNSMLSWFTDFRPLKKPSRKYSNMVTPELINEDKSVDSQGGITRPMSKKVLLRDQSDVLIAVGSDVVMGALSDSYQPEGWNVLTQTVVNRSNEVEDVSRQPVTVVVQASEKLLTVTDMMQASERVSTVTDVVQASEKLLTVTDEVQASERVLTTTDVVQASEKLLTVTDVVQASEKMLTVTDVVQNTYKLEYHE
jgi:PII-like signaling protein